MAHPGRESTVTRLFTTFVFVISVCQINPLHILSSLIISVCSFSQEISLLSTSSAFTVSLFATPVITHSKLTSTVSLTLRKNLFGGLTLLCIFVYTVPAANYSCVNIISVRNCFMRIPIFSLSTGGYAREVVT